MKQLISIDEKCIVCGRCSAICPAEIFISQDKIAPKLKNEDRCIVCGHCVAICPTEAIAHSEFPAEKIHNIDQQHLPTPKQVMEIIRARRSNRAFSKEKVDIELLQQIVEAAHRAPTASNLQKVHFTIVTSPEKLEQIGLLTINTFSSMLKTLENPFVKPFLRPFMKNIYDNYVPRFKTLKEDYFNGKDQIMRGATAAIFFHSPSEVKFGKEDCNLAYQNASLMAESLGVAHFYTGFVCSASSRSKHKQLAKILGVEGSSIHAGMALGVPKYQYIRYVDKLKMVCNII